MNALKRIIPFLAALLLTLSVSGQVFNTGQTLKRGTFSIGFEPVILLDAGNDFMLFGHAGFGLTKGVDLAVKLGGLAGNTYFGADVEFSLKKRISVSVGAHNFGDFGLDGTLNLTFPVGRAMLYTGVDTDLVLANDSDLLLWIPIGLELGLRKGMSFIFEAEIAANNSAYNLIGGGLNFYF